jgi:predicted nucleotidyltransferase component of viral defense system
MTTVNRMLKQWARANGNPPYWIVEKDYALGYLLAGIVDADEPPGTLLLKGGTALKKAYFADYRFSEDLDFSIHPTMRLDDADTLLQRAVAKCEQLLQERGAFRVEWERLELRLPHPGGQDAYVVRVQFPGQRQPLCRLKVEITHDELLLWPLADRDLIHLFPEGLTARISCYSLEEIVAEKLRALLQSRQRLSERGWGASRVCRDYYDLWYILGRQEVNLSHFCENLDRKCKHRGVSFESVSSFFDGALVQVAESEWMRQLTPFVRDCPPVESVLSNLRAIIHEMLT